MCRFYFGKGNYILKTNESELVSKITVSVDILFIFLAHEMHFVLAHGITEHMKMLKPKTHTRTIFHSHAWIRVNSTKLILITVES